jgi:DNA (cytosine-5)-methyltransferase 1
MYTMQFIEVFAGCGGLSTGLTEAGWSPLLLIDNDRSCIDTLRSNKCGAIVLQKDVKTLNLTDYKGKVPLLAGGIPCQAFSQAGLRRGTNDPRGNLFQEFARLITECEPHMFLIENVVGLLTHDKGNTFRAILSLLLPETYVTSHSVLNAHDYEVAQKRKRVFIVGRRKDLFVNATEFKFPDPLQHKLNLRDVLADCPYSRGIGYTEEKQKVMELIPPGGCWVDLPPDVQRQYMGGSFTSGGGKRGMAKRLSWNEPSLTLTTSPCQKQTERCHPEETRPLTVREYARIQSFPDEYIFAGSMMSQYRQIGNAVPVRLAYHIGAQLLRYYTDSRIQARISPFSP